MPRPLYTTLAISVMSLMLTACGNHTSSSNPSNSNPAKVDKVAPTLTLPKLTSTNQTDFNLAGKVSDNQDTLGLNVIVKNLTTGKQTQSVTDADGNFILNTKLTSGENKLQISVSDKAGNQANLTQKIILDNTAPVLTLTTQITDEISRTSQIVLTGVASDNLPQPLKLSIIQADNTQNFDIPSTGKFTIPVGLIAGDNQFIVSVSDSAGNTVKQNGKVYFGNTLAAGGSHTGAIVDGKVYAWGRNNLGQVGMGKTTSLKDTDHSTRPYLITQAPNNAVSISFSQNHSALLTKDGKVYTWGDDENGELGRGDSGRTICTDKVANCRLTIGAVDGLNDVISIASGYAHRLALTKSGEVWAFGSNSQGQLGQNVSVKNSSKPVKVNFNNVNVGKIIQVIASADTSYALDNKGQVWAWGSNQYGNLGNDKICDENDKTLTPNCLVNSSTPLFVPFASDVKISELAAGRDHLLAMTDKGQVYAWGLNFSSQVGYHGEGYVYTNKEWAENIGKPTLLPWSTKKTAKHIYANGNTSYVMFNNHTIQPWGLFGETDALGITDYLDLNEPTDKLANLTVTDMAVGALHQVAKDKNGGVLTWGWSFEGSLGDGATLANTRMYNTPIKVSIKP
ncbi:regulator of chromosome condensation [Moraxella macacae 0408225]|uniref:Regulator of chromosome condensation n=1 Tax=Moraxella macacae 0408225 TaxID=1230338 RepID=L2F6G3_9GAMM|nr:regulator of chromosome condensation [Moraxella macacae]ELA08033.1 regulator of chromosome condensation [Moraxella macacae 0408225]